MLQVVIGTEVWSGYSQSGREALARQEAQGLYRHVYTLGWLRKIWSTLRRRSSYLLSLAEIKATCRVHNSYYVGTQTVPIEQIRGSGGRNHDFDAEFKPLKTHTRDRWIDVATARRTGVVLPLVDLVQIGDVYFVTDGHHRISVARSHGQMEIEAKVTVWQTTHV